MKHYSLIVLSILLASGIASAVQKKHSHKYDSPRTYRKNNANMKHGSKETVRATSPVQPTVAPQPNRDFDILNRALQD